MSALHIWQAQEPLGGRLQAAASAASSCRRRPICRPLVADRSLQATPRAAAAAQAPACDAAQAPTARYCGLTPVELEQVREGAATGAVPAAHAQAEPHTSTTESGPNLADAHPLRPLAHSSTPPPCPAPSLPQPGLVDALAGAAASLTPAVAAATLLRLESELPPVLGQLAPGDSVLVALVPCLLPLLQRAAASAEQALAAGEPSTAAATARAAMRLLSRLDFGSHASAAPYAAVGVRCKQALKAAHDAGAPLSQEVRGD